MPGSWLYCDEDSLAQAVVDGLRRVSIDALTAAEAGMLGRTDEEQLAFASSLGRILYTANRSDFARLHAERMRAGATHAGIIIRVRQRMPVGAQIRALVAVNTLFGPGEMRSRLVYLDEYVE